MLMVNYMCQRNKYTLSIIDREDEYVYGILVFDTEEELLNAMKIIEAFDINWYHNECKGDYWETLSQLFEYQFAYNYNIEIR